MEKKCPECGEPIKGRIDKKFCSDLCRNAWNNKQNSDTTNYMRTVNNILRKNRRILLEFVEGKKAASVPKQKLHDKGYNFKHITHTYKTKTGDIYFYCYEYGYSPREKDFLLIVKGFEELK